eukprot:1158128-Pelagomonas_calceolata.AAC.4
MEEPRPLEYTDSRSPSPQPEGTMDLDQLFDVSRSSLRNLRSSLADAQMEFGEEWKHQDLGVAREDGVTDTGTPPPPPAPSEDPSLYQQGCVGYDFEGRRH